MCYYLSRLDKPSHQNQAMLTWQFITTRFFIPLKYVFYNINSAALPCTHPQKDTFYGIFCPARSGFVIIQ